MRHIYSSERNPVEAGAKASDPVKQNGELGRNDTGWSRALVTNVAPKHYDDFPKPSPTRATVQPTHGLCDDCSVDATSAPRENNYKYDISYDIPYVHGDTIHLHNAYGMYKRTESLCHTTGASKAQAATRWTGMEALVATWQKLWITMRSHMIITHLQIRIVAGHFVLTDYFANGEASRQLCGDSQKLRAAPGDHGILRREGYGVWYWASMDTDAVYYDEFFHTTSTVKITVAISSQNGYDYIKRADEPQARASSYAGAIQQRLDLNNRGTYHTIINATGCNCEDGDLAGSCQPHDSKSWSKSDNQMVTQFRLCDASATSNKIKNT